MAVYCSHCGHGQEQAMPYCPACGTRMAVPARPTLPAKGPPTTYDPYYYSGRPRQGAILPENIGHGALAPRYRERETRNVGGLVVWSVAMLLAVGFVFVRFGEAPTCREAEQVVQRHHSIIFGAMQLAGMGLTTSCSGLAVNPLSAARYASIGWEYQGRSFTASYWVAPDGTITAANLTAGTLDQAANQGVSALLRLLP
jgi:hypothetical protein